MFRRFLGLIVLAGILLFTIPVEAVSPPERDPDFIRPFMECSGNTGVYLKIWDTNPLTNAGFFSVGEYEIRGQEPIFHNPVFYIVTNDAGESRYYRADNGREIPEAEITVVSPCEAIVEYKPSTT